MHEDEETAVLVVGVNLLESHERRGFTLHAGGGGDGRARGGCHGTTEHWTRCRAQCVASCRLRGVVQRRVVRGGRKCYYVRVRVGAAQWDTPAKIRKEKQQ